jgi:hypothetical protein
MLSDFNLIDCQHAGARSLSSLLNLTSKIFALHTSMSQLLSRSLASAMQRLVPSNKVGAMLWKGSSTKDFLQRISNCIPRQEHPLSKVTSRLSSGRKAIAGWGLTGFSLEGILHAKQFTRQQSMSL